MTDRVRFKLSRVREIGWSLWDPIGLDGMENTPDDEYDRYLLHAAGQLSNGVSAAEVSDYLTAVELDHMGLEDAESARDRAWGTVAALRDYVVELRSEQR